jgi:hypothetical protein
MVHAATPFAMTCGDYTVSCTVSGVPAYYVALQDAVLVDTLDLDEPSTCCVWVHRRGEPRPLLVVVQGGVIHGAGFGVGALLVAETDTLFIGAGERILAYQLTSPRRLWQDTADTGFWSWERHGDTVLMCAELELAAWTVTGEKLWTTFVEPPWSHQVRGDLVDLEVMGVRRTLGLRTGRPET